MDIRLKAEQSKVLFEVVSHFKWKKDLQLEEKPTCNLLKSISEDDALELRELCSDYLLEVGFDDNYIANEKGVLLEELVDKLYVE